MVLEIIFLRRTLKGRTRQHCGQIYACVSRVHHQLTIRCLQGTILTEFMQLLWLLKNGSVSWVDIFQWAKSRLKVLDFLKEKENTVQTHQYKAYDANLLFSLTHWFSWELEVFSFQVPWYKPLEATLDSEGKKYLESAWCLNLFCSLKTDHFKKHFPMLYLVQLQVFISNKTFIFISLLKIYGRGLW